MAARRLAARTEIARPPAEVFAWVADHRNITRALDGVERWEPLGPRAEGVGARFAVRVTAAGLALDTVLVLDRWDEPRAIGWHSLSGPVRQTGGWRFTARRTGTQVDLDIAYEPPGGAFGGLVAGRFEGMVRQRLDVALERMRDALEDEA
jgi:carbon monoxide dehydrogenase subunit G